MTATDTEVTRRPTRPPPRHRSVVRIPQIGEHGTTCVGELSISAGAVRRVSEGYKKPRSKEGTIMWDTVQTNELHLSHDLPCPHCGHAVHSYLACSDTCACVPTVMPGTVMPGTVMPGTVMLGTVELAA